MKATGAADRFRDSFLDASPEEREAMPGVDRLHGCVTVQRFKSSIDFSIRVDAATSGEPRRELKGTFAYTKTTAFRPDVALGSLLLRLGLISPP
jgi:hypothetical protein